MQGQMLSKEKGGFGNDFGRNLAWNETVLVSLMLFS